MEEVLRRTSLAHLLRPPVLYFFKNRVETEELLEKFRLPGEGGDQDRVLGQAIPGTSGTQTSRCP